MFHEEAACKTFNAADSPFTEMFWFNSNFAAELPLNIHLIEKYQPVSKSGQKY
jgi:hypothetical protein